ncbi:MAG: hypothetical protein KDC61_13935, partial [Saprospiraceae bacterium]|nr:hypothetical protein [Saprospiraceae bacterium]
YCQLLTPDRQHQSTQAIRPSSGSAKGALHLHIAAIHPFFPAMAQLFRYLPVIATESEQFARKYLRKPLLATPPA